MTRSRELALPVLAIAGAAAATLLFSALYLVSRPAQADERAARAAAVIAQAKALERTPGAAAAWPAGALCDGATAAGASGLGEDIAKLAARSNIALETTAVAVDRAGAQGAVTPITVRLKGRGDYQATVRWLSSVAEARPVLFIDTFDLKPSRGAVEFQLTGAVWCWTPA